MSVLFHYHSILFNPRTTLLAWRVLVLRKRFRDEEKVAGLFFVGQVDFIRTETRSYVFGFIGCVKCVRYNAQEIIKMGILIKQIQIIFVIIT